MSEIFGLSLALFVIGMGVLASVEGSRGARVVCSVLLLFSWLLLFGIVLQMPARS